MKKQRGIARNMIATDMLSFIPDSENAMKKAKLAVDYFLYVSDTNDSYNFPGITLKTSIQRTGKIFCSGLNYKSHINENPNAEFLKDPRFFSKAPSIIIDPGEPIRHPERRFLVDWEVELAVIFRKKCYRVKKRKCDELCVWVYNFARCIGTLYSV
jgi:2-keto-4-pentenoate hydratase/2-oxohepta-3-ene-1,7-dioic acid hydratase in catechol pathway